MQASPPLTVGGKSLNANAVKNQCFVRLQYFDRNANLYALKKFAFYMQFF